MSTQPDPRTWLFDILEAGARVQRFLGDKSYADYVADDLLRAGVERQFEIIGEALNRLRTRAPDLAGSIREHARIIGFRNLLIHGYAIVDDAIVWDISSTKLVPLLTDVSRLLEQLNRQR